MQSKKKSIKTLTYKGRLNSLLLLNSYEPKENCISKGSDLMDTDNKRSTYLKYLISGRSWVVGRGCGSRDSSRPTASCRAAGTRGRTAFTC